MYSVSDRYKNDINKQIRNLSYIKVSINVVDPDSLDNSTTTDSGSEYISNTDIVLNGSESYQRYVTTERNLFVLDGVGKLPPEVSDTNKEYQGYVGNVISRDDRRFDVEPKVIVNFSDYFNFIGMSFMFDHILGSYPTEFEVKAYANGVEVHSSIQHPNDYSHIMDNRIPLCNRIEIIFKETSIPNRRPVMEYMVFGLIKSWNVDNITSSTWNRSIDLLSSKLPINSFEFTSIDLERDYNPDNANGLWQYVEQSQLVKVDYGYELDNGSVEWIKGARLYTTGEVKSSSDGSISKVTFNATSLLNQLNNVYYQGSYNPTPVSLYTLAERVFTFANLRLLPNGTNPYYIDPSLQTIYTNVPLPKMKINELLQLIANAGRCVLYVDREGMIKIERANEVSSDFSFDFNNMLETPKVDKVPPLYSVTTNFTNVNVDTASSSLYKAQFNLTENSEYQLSYESATDVTFTTTGTLTVVGTPVFYANACMITLNGVGQLELLGKKLKNITTSLTTVYGINGFDCPISNVLINNNVDAMAYSNWIASILRRRNQYTVKERGYPELDILDVIKADTLFSADLDSTIVANKLTYNGTLSAETTFITKEVN